ncbi:uncharacterized protein VTP21DRAFT_6720 [Calcarisporiella thermophila]|uniref:uncharacterized protein n=1 Tax=Calcarisporiella thermophila TaxID=911321 RepID=UPI003744603A
MTAREKMSNDNKSPATREYLDRAISELDTSLQDFTPSQLDTSSPELPQSSTHPIAKDGNSIPAEKETENEKEDANWRFTFHAPTLNPLSFRSDNSSSQSTSSSGSTKIKLPMTEAESSIQRREIYNAALANCAEKHEKLQQCFQNGKWWDKMRLCENERTDFWRCFHQQKKLLKALGFKLPNNTPEKDNEILQKAMHTEAHEDIKTEKQEDL